MRVMPAEDFLALCLLAALGVLGGAVAGLYGQSRWLRRQAQDAAAAQAQWSRALADAAFDGMLIHRQGVILQMNRALVRLLGARERECIGQHFANFAPPEQAAALRLELAAPGPERVEFLLLDRAKREIAVELCSQNIVFAGAVASATAIRDISQRRADAARIALLLHSDALTGLATRQSFVTRLAAALAACERGGAVALFTLDLDQFKRVNARLGRESGDRLLVQVAARLRALAKEAAQARSPAETAPARRKPEEMALARLGGDKFALALAGARAKGQALRLGGQMAAAFAAPFVVDGQLVRLGASIGLAVYPDHAGDAVALLQASGAALAAAQRAGGAQLRCFRHAAPVALEAADQIALAREA